jgi:hypothetical protein
MTSNIVNLSNFRRKVEAEKVKPALSKKETFHLFTSLVDELNVQWSLYASQDKLNQLIAHRLNVPPYDYVNDLNMISAIEEKMKRQVIIFHPGATHANTSGWLAGFHHDGIAYTTPEMVSEAYARSYALLLRESFVEAINNM